MGKKACKKKDFEDAVNAKYLCKKCGAKVKNEDKVCKAEKLK
jgi:transcription initiation factor IIE alpha subunit